MVDLIGGYGDVGNVSVETSIREGSVFEKSNLTIAEILQFIYWWSIGLTQAQIMIQMGMSSSSTCTWHTKCREICDYIVMQNPHMIGGKLLRIVLKEKCKHCINRIYGLSVVVKTLTLPLC